MYIQSLLGTPYKWGGSDPIEGFDCSGLCIELLIAEGKLPHKFDATSHGLYIRCREKFLPKSFPTFGDLAFYGTTKKVTHVGYCLDDKLMVEAGGGNSRTKSTPIAAEQDAFIRIRPIKYRKDFVGAYQFD